VKGAEFRKESRGLALINRYPEKAVCCKI